MIMAQVFSDAKREQKVDLNGYWSCMASLEIPSSTLLMSPGTALNFWWSQLYYNRYSVVMVIGVISIYYQDSVALFRSDQKAVQTKVFIPTLNVLNTWICLTQFNRIDLPKHSKLMQYKL